MGRLARTPSPVRVSVIVPTFNCAAFLGEALESVFRQGYAPLDVIVVDDGSTDETGAVLARYAARIQVLQSDRKGHGGARNVGIRAARGELIAFQDADDVWLPGKLQAQVRAMMAYPDVGLCFTDAELFDETGVLLPRMLSEEATGIRRRCLDARTGDDLKDVLVGWIFSDLLVGNAMQVPSVIVRRRCVEVVGRFDESQPLRAQDYDLWFRMAQRWPVALVDRALVRVRLWKDSASATTREGQDWDGQEEWRRRCRQWRAFQAKVRAEHLARIPPDLPAPARRQLGDYLLTKGWQELQAGRWGAARTWFRKCVRHGPGMVGVRAAAYWADSYLPATARQTIRRVHRALHRESRAYA